MSQKQPISSPPSALLVRVDFGEGDTASHLEELSELASSAGFRVTGSIVARRQKPDAALFVGSGKVKEIADAALASGAKTILFDHALTGIQNRNLEHETGVEVLDRVGLILEIFAQRAQSAEGKLQVELARLKYQLTRLVGGWTHLERQRGGIGLRGGPGETQLQLDRRMISQRIKRLNAQIEKLGRTRATQSKNRSRARVKTIALVGYTNAGKSTLFNRLARSHRYAANQLFATLDTTLRKLYVEGACPMVLSDTVGFIRDLPHELILAFRATLKEAAQADLLLHVIDASNPRRGEQIDAVDAVLGEIGASDTPQLRVLNKIDKTALAAGVERDGYGKIRSVRISAATGDGLDALTLALKEFFPAEQPVPEPDEI